MNQQNKISTIIILVIMGVRSFGSSRDDCKHRHKDGETTLHAHFNTIHSIAICSIYDEYLSSFFRSLSPNCRPSYTKIIQTSKKFSPFICINWILMFIISTANDYTLFFEPNLLSNAKNFRQLQLNRINFKKVVDFLNFRINSESNTEEIDPFDEKFKPILNGIEENLFDEIQVQKEQLKQKFEISEPFNQNFIKIVKKGELTFDLIEKVINELRFEDSGIKVIDECTKTNFFLYGLFKNQFKNKAIAILTSNMTPINKIIVLTALGIKYLKYVGESHCLGIRETNHHKAHPNYFLLASNIKNCTRLHSLFFEHSLITTFEEQLINKRDNETFFSLIATKIKCAKLFTSQIDTKTAIEEIEKKYGNIHLYLTIKIIIEGIFNYHL